MKNNNSADNVTRSSPVDTAEQSAINEALKQIGTNQKFKSTARPTSKKTWLWVYLVSTLSFFIVYQWLQHGSIAYIGSYLSLLIKFSLAGLLVSIILALGEFITRYLVRSMSDAASRFNLNRLIRLVAGFAITITLVSVFFVEWTTVLVSLGVLSIIFGLALQSSLNNLFAWFYILLRQPYRVGDRIRINDATGDVIDVGYLDTTLWEFGGQYLSTDHPSGRVIKFPNSMVLNTTVYNYSWPLFPYIWNEIRMYIAYGSDLDFVADTMREVALQEIGGDMARQVAVYRKLLASTPVDELEVNEEPVVLSRTHENTWIEVIVRYLAHPKKSGPLKTRILKRGLKQLNEQPDRVMFPRGDSR